MDPDALILASIANADHFLSAAESAINDIRSQRFTQYGGLTPPAINSDFPAYVKPAQDNTPIPVYEPPNAPLPTAPNLADVATIPTPAFPDAPVLHYEGLFQQVAPTTNIPDWNNAEPDLRIDALVAQMDALVEPVLTQLQFPKLTPLNIGTTPTLNLPSFDAPLPPDTLRDPLDYAALVDSKYQTMLPQIQGYIDDKVAGWISAYAPEFPSLLALLTARMEETLTDGRVLPDQFEAALYTRARGRAEVEFAAVEAGLADNYSKRGFIAPPGAVTAGLHAGRLKGADALANQATDIYIKRREMEVQHLQFVMQMAASQLAGVRSLALQYAGVIGNSIQQALAYSSQIGEMAIRTYEHLIARAQLAIAIMGALNSQYELKLKAALSGLEGFKLTLEAEKAKKDVELAQVQIIEAQLKAQEVEVSLYSAMVDAISRKASMEELKLKGYQTRADVFKTQIQAQVAGFDIYKASLEGDTEKAKAQLMLMEVYKTKLEAIGLELEANIKSTESTIASNDAKIKVFQSSGDIYKLDAQAAIQKFTALAEVKKLAQSIYSTELNGSVEIYKAVMEQPKLMIEAVLREYEGRLQNFETTGRLNIEELRRVQGASIALADGFSGIAQSALGSITSMVSSVKSTSG